MSTVHASIDGELVVDVVPEEGTDDEARALLQTTLDQFVRAIEIGLLMPGTLLGRFDVPSRSPGGIAIGFRASQMPLYGFRVLAGMLELLHEGYVRLLSRKAWERQDPHRDLLQVVVPLPQVPQPLPANVDISLGRSKTTPPLEVEIEFSGPVVDLEVREQLLDQLLTWNALMQGGYSGTGGLGESATANATARFILPTVARLQCEQWFAGRECFVPLLVLVGLWNQQRPISYVSVRSG